MRAEIVAIIFQLLYQVVKIGVSVKISGKEKRSFYILFFQCLRNMISSIGKFITGKNQCNILLSAVAPDNSTVTFRNAPCNRGVYFFGLLSASFAASR